MIFAIVFCKGDVGRKLFGGQPVPDIGGQIRSAVEDPTEAQRVHADGAVGGQRQQQQRGQQQGPRRHIAARGAADVRTVLVVQRERVGQRRQQRRRLSAGRQQGTGRTGNHDGWNQIFRDGDDVVVRFLGRDEQQVHANRDVLHGFVPVHHIGRRRLPVQHLRRRQSRGEPVPEDARVPAAVPRDIRRAQTGGRGQGRGRAAAAPAGRRPRPRLRGRRRLGRRRRRGHRHAHVRPFVRFGGRHAASAPGHAGVRAQPADGHHRVGDGGTAPDHATAEATATGGRRPTATAGRGGRTAATATAATGAAPSPPGHHRGTGGHGQAQETRPAPQVDRGQPTADQGHQPPVGIQVDGPGDAPAAQERQWRQAAVVAQVHVVRRRPERRSGSVARRGPTVR